MYCLTTGCWLSLDVFCCDTITTYGTKKNDGRALRLAHLSALRNGYLPIYADSVWLIFNVASHRHYPPANLHHWRGQPFKHFQERHLSGGVRNHSDMGAAASRFSQVTAPHAYLWLQSDIRPTMQRVRIISGGAKIERFFEIAKRFWEKCNALDFDRSRRYIGDRHKHDNYGKEE